MKVPVLTDPIPIQKNQSTDQPTDDSLDQLTLPWRKKVTVTGKFETCFLVTVNAQNKLFRMMLDTGSGDTVFPHTSINNYSKTNPSLISYTPPLNPVTFTNSYGDGSGFNAYLTTLPLTVPGINMTATCPVGLMYSQTTAPIFADGIRSDGLMGLARNSKSRSVLDAWYQQGAMSKRQMSFHACAFPNQAGSYVDFGNDTPYAPNCGNDFAYVKLPGSYFLNTKILEVSIAGVKQVFSSQFQKPGTSFPYSIFDSCTSHLLLPSEMVTALMNELRASSGISDQFKANSYFDDFLSGYGFSGLAKHLNFNKLPTISFTIDSGHKNYPNITLTLGPRQYIQLTAEGYYYITVSEGSPGFAILGIPFYTAYYMMVDYENSIMTIQRGCGCNTAVDGFPTISIPGGYNSSDITTYSAASATETMSINLTAKITSTVFSSTLGLTPSFILMLAFTLTFSL